MTAPTIPRVTPEDLLAMEDGHRYELVDGELVEREMSYESSSVGARFVVEFGIWDKASRRANLAGADAGLQIFPWAPSQVRFADASLTFLDRIPSGRPGSGHSRVAPDVVVEVVSPNDGADDVERKVQEYLRAGVRLVWVAYPETRTIHVFRPNGNDSTIREGQSLTGEEILPGFSVPLGELFGDVQSEG
jgi:Uma2 family endonuclease